MITLPENKPTEFNKTPRIFFIWGESMSGKTYLARQFPNPILLNTDGNADKVDTPSIKIENFKHFLEVMETLQNIPHTFETIIIDLIDDIELMLKNHVVSVFNEQLAKKKLEPINSIAELPFGQGYSRVMDTWKDMIMFISKMKFNIIFISHIIEKVENGTSIFSPALPQKPLNICLGRCDLQIQTRKLGNTYMKIITNKRDSYVPTDIKNEKISKALEGTIGLFEKPTVPPKPNNIITPNVNKSNNNLKNEGNDM